MRSDVGPEASGASATPTSPQRRKKRMGSGPAAAAACAAVLDHIRSGQADGTLDKGMVDDKGIAVMVFSDIRI